MKTILYLNGVQISECITTKFQTMITAEEMRKAREGIFEKNVAEILELVDQRLRDMPLEYFTIAIEVKDTRRLIMDAVNKQLLDSGFESFYRQIIPGGVDYELIISI